MSELVQLVTKAIDDGLDDDQIASLIENNEQMQKSFTADAIASAILSQRKMATVKQKMNQIKETEKTLEEEQKKIDEIKDFASKMVDEKFKTVNLNFGAGNVPKLRKKFSIEHGKYIELSEKEIESYSHFGKMLDCFITRDKASALSISKDIDSHNAKYLSEFYDTKVAVSDVSGSGGAAIPVEVSDTINQIIYTQSSLLSMTKKFTVNYNQEKLPVMSPMAVRTRPTQSTQLTESTPTFNSVDLTPREMYAFGHISNKFYQQKGAALIQAFTSSIASEIAKYIDTVIAVGSVSTDSDVSNGITFDTLTDKSLSTINQSALTTTKLWSLYTKISPAARDSVVFIANSDVTSTIGNLQAPSGGELFFKQFFDTGLVKPFGKMYIENNYITNTCNIAGSSKYGGTVTPLIAVNLNYVATALTDLTRIDISSDFRFDYDQISLRAIKSFGMAVMSGSGTAGIVAAIQPLTAGV